MSRRATPSPDPSGAGQAGEIVENLTTAVLLLDDGLRLVALNPAAQALLAVSANQVLGMPVRELWPEAGEWTDALARVAESGQPVTDREMTLTGLAPQEMTVDCMVTPVPNGDGPGGLLVELVALDRHKRISREEQLVAQTESARALVRGLAHEIKNPLGGIRGAAQLLERELTEPELAEYTQVIVREADRLQRLLDRMTGPRSMPRMRPINVHEITERVRALVEAEAPPGVTVERDYDPSIPELRADAELLIQATLNVARNAIQAVDGAGTVRLRTRVQRQLTVGHRRHRLVVCIDVTDTGPGVPPELREQIFYPMVTGRSDGTGLGLSIAQILVNRHGGLIECASEPGETTFSILLPVDSGE